MRVVSRTVLSIGLLLPLLATACGKPDPRPDDLPVVTAFSDGTSPAGQARHAQEAKARADLEQCRKTRQQGVYARERRFPCESFLGE
ncbi:MAG TPA: hypothetical protein VF771_18520 [Longimicrobiaceae bacterium]